MTTLKALPSAAAAAASATACGTKRLQMDRCFWRAQSVQRRTRPNVLTPHNPRAPSNCRLASSLGISTAQRPLEPPAQPMLFPSRSLIGSCSRESLGAVRSFSPARFLSHGTIPSLAGRRHGGSSLRRAPLLSCLPNPSTASASFSVSASLPHSASPPPSANTGPPSPGLRSSQPQAQSQLFSSLAQGVAHPSTPHSASAAAAAAASVASAVAVRHSEEVESVFIDDAEDLRQGKRLSRGHADLHSHGHTEGRSNSHHKEHRPKSGRFRNGLEPTPMTQEAWELLQASSVYYCNQPVGTVAASDPTDSSPLNYDQVFIRDFIPSALAFMLSGQSDIVRNFLLYTLQLQSWEKTVDCYRPGEGLMPASFKVTQVPVEGGDYGEYEEHLDPDFGEAAIGRVAPVDSGLWWIQLLRAYGRCTGDYSLVQRLDVQTGIKLILKVCLADHFDMFPTLITTDGPCMIDRRMGIHGHPLEIQSLLYGALRAAKEMLLPENGGAELIRAIDARLTALSFHVRQYYWLDQKKLNEIYRYKTEEYSYEAVNKFNIYPEQIPSWLMEWIPDRGGYLVGNVQPAHMDFRFFSLGNLWAVVSALASPQQAEAVLDLVEERWDDLVAAMPLKIVYPALENEEWRIITGADPKNTPWSYHNGGSWPVLLWQFTAACIKMGRPHLAEKAIEVAERKLQADRWPEYYDTKSGRFVGKQARLHQTWSIAGYLSSKLLLANPEAVWLFAVEEDHDIAEATTSFLNCTSTGSKRRRFRQPSPLPLISHLAADAPPQTQATSPLWT